MPQPKLLVQCVGAVFAWPRLLAAHETREHLIGQRNAARARPLPQLVDRAAVLCRQCKITVAGGVKRQAVMPEANELRHLAQAQAQEQSEVTPCQLASSGLPRR